MYEDNCNIIKHFHSSIFQLLIWIRLGGWAWSLITKHFLNDLYRYTFQKKIQQKPIVDG